MKVIALRGAENTGKSHTINIVYQYLLRDKWIQEPGHFRILGNPIFNDVFDVLVKDNTKLGIIGMGDYQIGSSGLASLIKEQVLLGCDIVICACRTNSKIEKAVTNYTNHFFIDKTIGTGQHDYRVVNGIDADQIFDLV